MTARRSLDVDRLTPRASEAPRSAFPTTQHQGGVAQRRLRPLMRSGSECAKPTRINAFTRDRGVA